MNIGKLIKAYREQHKISIRQLAKRIGVEHTKLWRFEEGHEVQTPVWVAIIKWALTDSDLE